MALTDCPDRGGRVPDSVRIFVTVRITVTLTLGVSVVLAPFMSDTARAGDGAAVMAALQGRHAECRYLKRLCRDLRRADRARAPAYEASAEAHKRHRLALEA